MAMEAFVLYRYTDRDVLQKTLLSVIGVWIVISVIIVTNLIQIFYEGKAPQIPGVFNFFDIVISGVGILSLLCYPVMAINPRLAGLRPGLLYFSPIIATLAIYLLWHAATGHNIDYRYMSTDELWDKAHTVPVILRFLMVFFFTVYTLIILYNLWNAGPVYAKDDNDAYPAGNTCNTRWARGVVAAIGVLLTVNIILLFSKTVFTETVYAALTITLFIIMTENAVFHKAPESNGVLVKRSFKNGWEKGDESVKTLDKEKEDDKLEMLGLRLDQWMKENKPFSNPEFSAKDIFNAFPELDYNTMTRVLAKRKHTFQSYVRQHRIDEACRLMRKNPALKGCAISYNIGFSSPPSFTRAFVAVMGVTPMQFKENSVKKEIS